MKWRIKRDDGQYWNNEYLEYDQWPDDWNVYDERSSAMVDLWCCRCNEPTRTFKLVKVVPKPAKPDPDAFMDEELANPVLDEWDRVWLACGRYSVKRGGGGHRADTHKMRESLRQSYCDGVDDRLNGLFIEIRDELDSPPF